MKTRKLLPLAGCVVAALIFSGCSSPAFPEATAANSAPTSTAATAVATANPSPPVAIPAATQISTAPTSPTATVEVRVTPTTAADLGGTPTASHGNQPSATTTLTVEEYPIVSKDVDTPTHLEYRQRISPMVLEKRKQWREVAPQELMVRANQALDSFGYKLSPTEQPGCPICVSFRLYRQGNLVVSNVEHFRLPIVAEDGSDFAMLVEDRQGSFVVRKDEVITWKPDEHAFTAPALLGNDLLTLVQPQPDKCEVRKGDEVLYSFTPPPQVVDNPIKGLWAWQRRWVLEVDGTVLIDGRNLNEENGYDEVFGWRLIDGDPFYFFRKGKTIGVSYAGQTLPYSYDEVIHYQCCEPAAFNVGGNDTMVWFHALRGETYYYVEMGRY